MWTSFDALRPSWFALKFGKELGHAMRQMPVAPSPALEFDTFDGRRMVNCRLELWTKLRLICDQGLDMNNTLWLD